MRRIRGGTAGFTLIEILVVVAIIALLATIAIPNVKTAIQRAKRESTSTQIKDLAIAIEKYKSDLGDYPPSGSEKLYVALSTGLGPHAKWKGPYYSFKDSELGEPNADPAKYQGSVYLHSEMLIPHIDIGGTTYQYRSILDSYKRALCYVNYHDYAANYGNANGVPSAFDSSKKNGISCDGETKTTQCPECFENWHSFQLYSLGEDGKTMLTEQCGTGWKCPGPGGLSGFDGIDNDGDGLIDWDDNAGVKNNDFIEDDINNWS